MTASCSYHKLVEGGLGGRGCTVRTLLGNYTPQTDPHKEALDSNIGTKETAGKWVSHQSLRVTLMARLTECQVTGACTMQSSWHVA